MTRRPELPDGVEDARDFAGVPDDTQRLDPAPMAYIGGENKPEDPHDDAVPVLRAPATTRTR